MADTSPSPDSLEGRRPAFPLRWFLLAIVVLVVVVGGLSIWLSYRREQQIVEQIKCWGGRAETYAVAPVWMPGRVGSVDLSGTKVVDSDLSQLSGLPGLTHLALSDTAVSDVGLFHLRRCEILQSLCLDGTKVTD